MYYRYQTPGMFMRSGTASPMTVFSKSMSYLIPEFSDISRCHPSLSPRFQRRASRSYVVDAQGSLRSLVPTTLQRGRQIFRLVLQKKKSRRALWKL